MRHAGSVNEYKEQQDAEIVSAFRRIFSIYGGIATAEQMYVLTSVAPASRFFVSPERAAIVIAGMKRGKMAAMSHSKKRMYQDLKKIVDKLSEEKPELSMLELCRIAVTQPAPEFYKSWRMVQDIIRERKTKCYETRKRKLFFACM